MQMQPRSKQSKTKAAPTSRFPRRATSMTPPSAPLPLHTPTNRVRISPNSSFKIRYPANRAMPTTITTTTASKPLQHRPPLPFKYSFQIKTWDFALVDRVVSSSTCRAQRSVGFRYHHKHRRVRRTALPRYRDRRPKLVRRSSK